MGKQFGKCALCGEECELSFEHIPPKKAFNDYPSKFVAGEVLLFNKKRLPWDVEGLPYVNQQKGMGVYSLCEPCNNKTGSWYGTAYSSIAHIAQQMLSNPLPSDADTLVIKGGYPLRFIKQVVSMFCSANPNADIDDLREFVLNKEAVGVDRSKYRIHMYFTKSTMRKIAPITGVMKSSPDGFVSIALSEITVPPLGFILYFNPSDEYPYEGMDITDFSKCRYDEKAEMYFPLCVLEVNDIFPTDYRTKEEIIRTIDKNEKWMKEHESEENI